MRLRAALASIRVLARFKLGAKFAQRPKKDYGSERLGEHWNKRNGSFIPAVLWASARLVERYRDDLQHSPMESTRSEDHIVESGFWPWKAGHLLKHFSNQSICPGCLLLGRTAEGFTHLYL